jgi:hypothetical protein
MGGNERTASGSIFDENVADNRQEIFFRPNNQSIVSNAGEIYAVISGLVDQKFAEKQLIERQMLKSMVRD